MRVGATKIRINKSMWLSRQQPRVTTAQARVCQKPTRGVWQQLWLTAMTLGSSRRRKMGLLLLLLLLLAVMVRTVAMVVIVLLVVLAVMAVVVVTVVVVEARAARTMRR